MASIVPKRARQDMDVFGQTLRKVPWVNVPLDAIKRQVPGRFGNTELKRVYKGFAAVGVKRLPE